MKQLWLLIGLLIGLVPPVSAVEALSEEDFDKIQVFLAETAAVSDEEYTLGEIAELQGNDPNLVDRIVSLKVGRSPLPGQKSDSHSLSAALRSTLPQGRYRQVGLPINDTVKVYRAALKVPEKILKKQYWPSSTTAIQTRTFNPSHWLRSTMCFYPVES